MKSENKLRRHKNTKHKNNLNKIEKSEEKSYIREKINSKSELFEHEKPASEGVEGVKKLVLLLYTDLTKKRRMLNELLKVVTDKIE